MRQDVYRVAYDEAHLELLEISKRFEELHQRKVTLESVVTALGPVLGVALSMPMQQQASDPVGEASPPASQAPPETASYAFNEVSSAPPDGDESITDPFQRRVRNALKFSSNNNGNNNGHEHKGLQPAV